MQNNDDILMDLQSYKESLIGGGFDSQEVEAIISEMQTAKVGTIKPNYWEKISDNEFLIYCL